MNHLLNIKHPVPVLPKLKQTPKESKVITRYLINSELHRMGTSIINPPAVEKWRAPDV